MSNAVRLRILIRLQQGETSVGTLVDEIGISQSALSQHLAKLRARGLVTSRRESQTIYYSCSSPAVAIVLKALEEISRS